MQVYYGAYGATEPTDSNVTASPSAGIWTDLGGTSEGLTLTINREFSEMSVDQVLYVIESRPTKIDPQVKTSLAEATLANLSKAMNGGTVVTSSGYSTYDPDVTENNFQPTYYALLLDGWAPGSAKRRRVIVRKALSIESIETAWKKDGMTLIPATWRAHYIDSSTKPFHIVDAT